MRVIIFLLCLSVTMSAAIPEVDSSEPRAGNPAENLLVNGDFEADKGQPINQPKAMPAKQGEMWNFSGCAGNFYSLKTGTFGYSSEKAAGGRYSLRISGESPASRAQLIFPRIPVIPGGNYLFEAAYFADDAQGLTWSVSWYDEAGNHLKTPKGEEVKSEWLLSKSSDGRWVTESQEFRTPSGAHSANLYIICKGQRTLYLDNLSLKYVGKKEAALKPGNMLDKGSSFEAGLNGCEVTGVGPIKTFPTWLASIDDTTSVHGARSLKIDITQRPEGYEKFICWLGYKVIPGFIEGQKYTLSCYAKASRPCGLTLGVRGPGWGWLGKDASGGGKLSNAWSRLHITFVIPPGAYEGRYWFWIQICHESLPPDNKGAPVTVWLDAVQMEPGELSDYKALSGTELALQALPEDKHGIFYTDEKKVSFLARSFNAGGVKGINLRYRLIDLYSGREMASGSFEPIELEDAGHGAHKITLTNPGQGIYRLLAEEIKGDGTSGASAETPFGFITKAEDMNPEPESFFGIHIQKYPNSWWGGLSLPRKAECASFMEGNASPEFHFKLARDIGARWLRSFDIGYYWSNLEYAPNTFRWPYEWMVDLADKYGIKIMGVLWGAGGSGGQYTPAWAKTGLANKTKCFKNPIPREEAWANYVSNMVSHYKGRVDHWELMNEPGSGFEASEYVPLLKAGYQALKRANPDARAVGICGTGDYGEPFGWIRECLKLGAADYLDVISVHSYCSSENLSKMLKQVQVEQTLADRHVEIWDTETGTPSCSYSGLLESTPPTGWTDLPPGQAADRFVQAEIRYMAEARYAKHFYFLLDATQNYICMPVNQNLLNYDLTPKSTLIAYDVMADMLHDKTAFHKAALPGEVSCFVFERKNRCPAAVMWTDGKKKIQCALNTRAANLLTTDPVGRRLNIGTSGLLNLFATKSVIEFSASPFYLEAPRMDFKQLLDLLENAELKGVDIVKPGRLYFGWGRDTGPYLLATAESLAKNIEADFAVEEFPSTMSLAQRQATVKAEKKGEIMKFMFPVKFNTAVPDQTAVFKGKLTSNRTAYDMPLRTGFISCPMTKHAVTLDGDMAEWKDASWVTLGDRYHIVLGDSSKYGREKDLLAKTAVMYNKEYLYCAVKVDDDVVIQKHPDALYKHDCVELFFDFDLEGDLTGPLSDEDDLQLSFAPDAGQSGPALINISCKGRNSNERAEKLKNAVKAAYRKTDSGYILETAIELSAVGLEPEDHDMIGFDFSVDDVDDSHEKAERKYQMTWCSGPDAHKNPLNFGRLIFTGNETKQVDK